MKRKVAVMSVILTLILSACAAQEPDLNVQEEDLNVPEEYRFEHVNIGSFGEYTIQGPDMDDFREGLCAVWIEDGVTPNKESGMGLLDTDGKVIVPYGVYDFIGPFFEGLSVVQMRDETSIWGFTTVGVIDKEGNLVIPIQSDYDEVSVFLNGMAIVSQGGERYGAIDQKGKLIIPVEYDTIQMAPFHNKPAIVKKGGKYGLIDQSGSIVVPLVYDWIGCDFVGDGEFYTVKKDEKWGFINTKGELIIPLKYDLAGYFHEGLACVGKKEGANYKMGFIDRNNKIVIPFEYDMDYKDASHFNFNDNYFEGFYFDDGTARVYKGEEWGYIDRSNRIIIPFGEYDEAEGNIARPFDKGEPLIVSKADSDGNLKYGVVDRSGEMVVPVRYDELFHLREDRIGFRENEKVGLMDEKGKIVIPAKYDSIDWFSESLAGFEQNGKWGYMDTKGKIVIPAEYVKVRPFSEGLAWVQADDGWELLKKISEKQ